MKKNYTLLETSESGVHTVKLLINGFWQFGQANVGNRKNGQKSVILDIICSESPVVFLSIRLSLRTL